MFCGPSLLLISLREWCHPEWADLPILVNTIKKTHSCVQRPVFHMIPDFIKLTLNSNYHKYNTWNFLCGSVTKCSISKIHLYSIMSKYFHSLYGWITYSPFISWWTLGWLLLWYVTSHVICCVAIASALKHSLNAKEVNKTCKSQEAPDTY